ncbi:hypothetical protein [Paenibacillus sp. FSL L8-0709]|uniref:hypothetical protein n=1 Tax=Paenibacillus sp. FSL L8-0709 TaxID=2975312 RepID=UPI0030F577AA
MSLIRLVMKVTGLRENEIEDSKVGHNSDISQEALTMKENTEEYEFVLNREYTPTERYPLSISRLKKIIKWSSSRYNERRKTDVIKDILKNISQGKDGYWEYDTGLYTEKSKLTSTKYRLVIRNRKIKILVNYDQVIEFY